jgi:Holliday junction resolvase
MKESQFCRELKKSLQQHGWFVKFHGGQFTEPGVPDIIGCINGKFVAIECKLSTGKVSVPQRQQLNNIIAHSGKSYLIVLELNSKPLRAQVITSITYFDSIANIGLFFLPRLPGGAWDVSRLLEDIKI